jgi:hypothetical protein
MMKFMCKKEFFQSSGTKNLLFKVQGQKINFLQSLGTKTILLPKFFCLVWMCYFIVRMNALLLVLNHNKLV